MTRTSSSCSAMAASAWARPAGLSGGAAVIDGAPEVGAGRVDAHRGGAAAGGSEGYGVVRRGSRDVHPVQGALDGLGPAGVSRVALLLAHGGGPAPVLLP